MLLRVLLKTMRRFIAETSRCLPDALIVLVGPYWNLQYDTETWEDEKYQKRREGKFGLGDDELVLKYNSGIAELAKRYNAIFVNVYHTTAKAGWLLHNDTCHFNDIGQWIIGQTVFSAVARHCSFLATKSIKAFRELGVAIPTTGGTNALPHVINSWRQVKNWGK